ncbi:MAG: hypothetical protein AMS14_04250 [Planctomycetes bacterium DG_20]|nr:MAG: hypothetical protein AMS14_04250 [Planctomycetes bacterium DG_20]
MLQKTIIWAAVAGVVFAVAPAAQAGVILPGTVGYWSFEDNTPNDQSGNPGNANCVWVGTAVYSNDTPGPGSLVSIDLRARNAAIGAVNEQLFDTASHSIAFWTKGPPTGDWGNWASKTTETDGWMIRQHASGRTSMYYDIRSGGNDLGLGIDHSDNVWRHYVMTYDVGTNRKLIYENGVQVAGPQNGRAGGPLDSARTLVWGDRDSNDAPGYQASGGGNYIGTMLDELYFIDRAITLDEVLQLYNDPLGAPEGSLHIFKFLDDCDGVFEPGEPILPQPFPFRVTDAQGVEQLVSSCETIPLPEGRYTITELVPPGWIACSDNPFQVDILPGQLTEVFFGNMPKGDIPEPVTLGALGLALAGLGGYVRRRRRF